MDCEHHRTSSSLKRYNPAADPAPPSQFFDLPSASRAPHDDCYNEHEHRSQRRRMEAPWHQHSAQRHYPGDGYDFRTPVMSAQHGVNMDWTHNEHNTIDLTEDRRVHSPPHMRIHLPPAPDGGLDGASGSASRSQRGPRFDRNIINLDNSDEEDHTHRQRQRQHHTREDRVPEQLPAQDEESLFMPDTQNEGSTFTAYLRQRPTTSGLRRPETTRNPSTSAWHDEVEVVASRSISRHPSRRATPTLSRPDSTVNNAGSTTIDLTADDDDDDDDVIHTRTRTLPGINGDRPAMAGSGIGTRERPAFGVAHLAQAMRAQGASANAIFNRFPDLDAANTNDAVARAREHQRVTRDNADRARQHALHLQMQVIEARQWAALQRLQPQAEAPTRRPVRGVARPVRLHVDLDFGRAAFDMGMGGGPARPPTPKYEPPPPAEDGFTRSPEEDEEVVCPNCGDELAVSEDETKAQVWVVKGCGHAYCGECATRTRTQPHSKKGKGRAVDPSTPLPLKKCVVVGCEKQATKSHMIHVYMSS